jgi:alanine racemase
VIHHREQKQTQSRPSFAEIELAAIAFNLIGIRTKVGAAVRIMAVVKANAYGHGDVAVAGFVEKDLVDYFGVAFVEEGVTLRKSGIKKPVHVFTLPVKHQIGLYFDFNLEPTVCSVTEVDLLEGEARKRKQSIAVHLKIETGMNRIGIHPKDLGELVSGLQTSKRVEIKGVYTHFATADQKDKSFTLQQFDHFMAATEALRRHAIYPELVHCANSSAILDLPQTYCAMVRPGITMYGYYPSFETSKSIPLKPAMSVKTTVSMAKTISSGESVSYGRRFVARKRTNIATLPLGYADGYSRLLTGKGIVLIHGKRFPIVGTICMDQMMVDVGDADVVAGDEAVLIGAQDNQRISCWDLAERIGTIPYEILCGVSARMPRIYRD